MSLERKTRVSGTITMLDPYGGEPIEVDYTAEEDEYGRIRAEVEQPDWVGDGFWDEIWERAQEMAEEDAAKQIDEESKKGEHT